VGTSVGLPAIWVLFAITVGGGLFGIPGMVIGVPVLGVAANLAKAALPREPDGEKTKPGGET
jgi:predicted PurR-regulated permease PerM